MSKKESKKDAPNFEIVDEEISVIETLIKNKALRLLPVVSKFVEALYKIAQEIKSLRDDVESLKKFGGKK